MLMLILENLISTSGMVEQESSKGIKSPSLEKVSKVLGCSESLVFSNLIRGTLEGISKPKKGFIIIPKASVQKAAKLLYQSKFKYVRIMYSSWL